MRIVSKLSVFIFHHCLAAGDWAFRNSAGTYDIR